MDLLYSQIDKRNEVSDSQHDSLHFVHKGQGMDLCIFDLYKPS